MGSREFWLIVVVSLAIVLAGVVGKAGSPGAALRDPRRSVLLAGPSGAKGLADALSKLGVTVERRRWPLFELEELESDSNGSALLVLLDVSRPPTGVERGSVRDFVARGNNVLLAGRNGVEGCFTYRVIFHYRYDADSVSQVRLPPDLEVLPDVHSHLERIPSDSLLREGTPAATSCEVLVPRGVDTLLTDEDGRAVALRLGFRGGGSATLVADSRFVSNQALKETDAGLLVIPWILAEDPARIVFDEYHHGFRSGSSMFGAAWEWARRSPLGWVMLQLSTVALLWLGFVAVQRRSVGDWIESLPLSVRTPEARRMAERLAELLAESDGGDRAVEAASTVEDLWQALGQPSRRREY